MNPSIFPKLFVAAFLLTAIVHSNAALAASDCKSEMTAVKAAAEKEAEASKKEKALKLLAKAQDELVTEADADECLDYVAEAKAVLGL